MSTDSISRAARAREKVRGEVARTREHDGGVLRLAGGHEKGPGLRYRRRDLLGSRLSPDTRPTNSERFRSGPRTCSSVCGNLSVQ
jgi:hypothetical protein